MAVIKMKPTSPGRRGMVKVTRDHLHKGDGYAPLLEPQHQKAGRNNNGRSNDDGFCDSGRNRHNGGDRGLGRSYDLSGSIHSRRAPDNHGRDRYGASFATAQRAGLGGRCCCNHGLGGRRHAFCATGAARRHSISQGCVRRQRASSFGRDHVRDGGSKNEKCTSLGSGRSMVTNM